MFINQREGGGWGVCQSQVYYHFFFFKKSEFALEISINVMKNEEKKCLSIESQVFFSKNPFFRTPLIALVVMFLSIPVLS